MKINWNILVNVRMWLINFDTDVTDVTAGVRFNREHLKKVLIAREEKLNNS